MSFALLALICAVALVGPLLSLARHLSVPAVIGELAVGIALGPTLLGVVASQDPTLSFFGEVGFALVMFVAGTHVPVRDARLRTVLVPGVLRAGMIALTAVPVGLGIAWFFGNDHGPLYAVLLASSSASIVLPSLEGTEIGSPSGLAMLPQLAIADAACIVALPLVVDPAHAPRAALGALALLVGAVGCCVVLRWLEATGRRRRLHKLSQERHLALELRALLVLLFALAALATALHVSVMLAGFALGLAVSAAGEPRRISNQMFALTEGLFGPIFFVWLGSSLDLRELVAHPQAVGLGLALGAGALVVHALGTLTRQPVALACATAAQLGVPVGAAALGVQTGRLGCAEPTSLLLGALVTIAAVTALTPAVRRAVVAPTAASPNRRGAVKDAR